MSLFERQWYLLLTGELIGDTIYTLKYTLNTSLNIIYNIIIESLGVGFITSTTNLSVKKHFSRHKDSLPIAERVLK